MLPNGMSDFVVWTTSQCSATLFVSAVTLIGFGILCAWAAKRIQYLGPDEQVLLKELDKKRVISGPAIVFPPPFTTLSYKKRKGETLTKEQYAKITDKLTGTVRIESGPCVLFLGPYDEGWQYPKEPLPNVRDAKVLREEESLIVQEVSGAQRLVKGPTIFVPKSTDKSWRSQDAISLRVPQFVVVGNSTTGTVRVERGPQVLFLQPNETASSIREGYQVKAHQQIRLCCSLSGSTRVERGVQLVFPTANEVPLDVPAVQDAIDLKAWQYVIVTDQTTGKVRVERGEQLLFLQADEQVGPIQDGFQLEAHQQVRLRCSLSGTVRVERGVQLVFPDAHDQPVDDPPVQNAINLKAWEYTTIQDMTSGKVHIVRGETLLFLGPTERTMRGVRKNSAIVVDKTHAVLIRNRDTGVQRLVDEPQLFVPSPQDEVIEIRDLISLADHQAIVLKNEKGVFDIRFGDPSKGTQRAFFLPPHWEIVTLMWSRGRRREKRDLAISIFDMRPQYMSFEFNCRTSDNVEMTLEGTFFWEVADLESMLRFTGDAPGDVCSHARSCFIQLVSKVTLQEFMATFNAIAHSAHSGDDEFYSRRGIKIHSLEVTRYACADRSTAEILEQIISETTNRMNRLSCQESENEVLLARLKGEEDMERARSEVLAIQQKHAIQTARSQGLAEAERLLAFLNEVQKGGADKTGGGADSEDSDTYIVRSQKQAEDLWHALRRAEGLHAVAQGNAHVYFTPDQANLTIETKPVDQNNV